MKTLISLLLLSLFVGFAGCAQNQTCDKFFNTYEGKKGVMSFNFNGSFLNHVNWDDPGINDCKISSIKVILVEDSTLNQKYNFYNEIVPKLNTKDYEELFTVKKVGQKTIALCRKNNKKITEFILVSGGKKNSLVYINGLLSLKDCRKISMEYDSEYDFDEMESKIQD